jgi:hypothetical protein
MLPGEFDANTDAIPSELIQEEPVEAIDFRLAGIGMSACERALNQFSWPAALHPIWPTIYRLGIRDDRASGRFLDALQVADVIFLEGERFDFAAEVGALRGTVAAIAFPLFDECGDLVDLAAWNVDGGRLALWRGVASMLGAENIFAPRLGQPLLVHETPLDWLRAGRRGVFIVDPQRAAPLLRLAEPLGVKREAHGRSLRQVLTIPAPRIVVASNARAAA